MCHQLRILGGFVLLLFLLTGCGGGGSATSFTAAKALTQTFAGYYSKDVTTTTPCYWNVDSAGSVRTDLPLTIGLSSARAVSSIMSGGTVYVAGSYFNYKNNLPCYWQGTTRNDLPIPSTDGFAWSIAVDSGTIYVAGESYNGTIYTPCYWKVDNTGAVRIDLPVPNGTTNATTRTIVVDNGTIYVAGSYSNGVTYTPCYWKVDNTGAVRTDLLLQGSGYGYAYSIAINSGTIYVAGMYYNASCYWKVDNSGVVKTDLPVPSGSTYSVSTSIVINNGAIYVAGNYINYINGPITPCYWKVDNSEAVRTDLSLPSGNDGYANSIAVVNGIVFSGGFYTNGSQYVPCYWNGTSRTDLPVPTGYDGWVL